ncbi:hypothetical protein MAPG_01524 [Magnaporthiopsis poae ATCC 64411]|uniref:Rhodopsin domain-containing protein n=1 Tax=Magnaporthiopsis poae (strain ATCC 64411 / 73-15) TaxID=644358 RepID=A0A0C4DNX5_MAGP6|nr:hypothetical protein MAPG_01524 [Magnaporthiopsis poae ATCC 64411]
MERSDCGGGAIPRPPGFEPSPECLRDAGMRGLNFAVQTTATILIVGFFIARSFAKWAVSSPIRAEDWFCVAALIVTLGYLACIFAMHHYGDGYHAWDLTAETLKYYKRSLYVSAVLYCPAAYLTKVTLLLLIARVFSVKEQVSRGIYMFIILITVLYTPVQIIKTIMCVPTRAFWDPDIRPDFCFDTQKVFIADIALATFTDAVILVLPVLLAWPLRLSACKRLKIAAMLGAGGGAVGTDVLRMYKVIELQYEQDTSGRFGLLPILTTLELTTGFVCACVPPINLLLERCLHRTRFSPNNPRTPPPPRRRSRIAAAFTMTDRAGSAPTLPKRLSNRWSSLLTATATTAGTSTRTRLTTASENGTSYGRMPASNGRGKEAAAAVTIAEQPVSPEDMFNVDVERALMTGRPLSRVGATNPPGDETTGHKAGSSMDWLRRMTSSSRSQTRNASPTERSTAGGWSGHRASAEAASQLDRAPSSATSCDLGGITKTVQISLEGTPDGEGPSSAPQPPPPSSPGAAANTYAAYDGSRRKLIPETVWDGRTVEDEEEAHTSF